MKKTLELAVTKLESASGWVNRIEVTAEARSRLDADPGSVEFTITAKDAPSIGDTLTVTIETEAARQ